MKFSVLGCGRWGTFIAWYLEKIGHDVTVWGRKDSPSFTALRSNYCNEYVTLHKNVKMTDELKQAEDFADILILSISCQGLRDLVRNLSADKNRKPVVLCMKGIEAETGKRLSEIAREYLPTVKVAVWVGPGHIQCFTAGIPNCMLIDSEDTGYSKLLIDQLSSDLIKFYQGDDMIGSEIGAAAKNVIGIAAGMLDGANLSTLKGALMARGSREIARLIKAMGGNELSAYGLCHLGDYETTLFSPYSNNRNFGEKLIQGEHFLKLAEGVKTADGLMVLSKKHHTELPITSVVQRVVNHKEEPMKLLGELFSRSNRIEFN